jgi:hypothetical protein
VDVKATTGEGSDAFHMSMAEVRWAANHPSYRIARISRLTKTSATLVVLSGVHELCKALLPALVAALPSGIAIDSVEVSPGLLRVVTQTTITLENG